MGDDWSVFPAVKHDVTLFAKCINRTVSLLGNNVWMLTKPHSESGDDTPSGVPPPTSLSNGQPMQATSQTPDTRPFNATWSQAAAHHSAPRLQQDRSAVLGSRFCPTPARTSVEQCAREGTVVVTTISRQFSSSMQRLVKAANQSGGFTCVVVFPLDDIPELCNPHILPVRIEPPFLPDHVWCNVSKMNTLWGWARAQLYKTYALAFFLRRGFDVLLLDADHSMSADPMPVLRKARAQSLDVVAQMADPQKGKLRHFEGYLNFGVSWTRASPRTSVLAQRLHNRSFRGWDQYLWNVEVDAGELACCQAKKQLPIGSNPQPNKPMQDELLCAEPLGPSIGPPQSSRQVLGPKATEWDPWRYNVLGWHEGRFATTCTKSCQFSVEASNKFTRPSHQR